MTEHQREARRAYVRQWNAANAERLAEYRKRARARVARMSESELVKKHERDRASWTRSNAKRAAAREQLSTRACDVCGNAFQPDRATGRFCTDRCRRIASRYHLPARRCERCGKEYRPPDSNPQQRFCGNRCSYDSRLPKWLAARECASCGKRFQPKRAEQVTCGKACGYAMRHTKSADCRRRQCAECGVLFMPIRRDGIYCSRACSGSAKSRAYSRQVAIICEVCGNGFLAKRARTAVRFCSNECRGATPDHPFKVHAREASAAASFLRDSGIYPSGPLSSVSRRRSAALAYVRKFGLL